VNATPWPLYARERELIHILLEAGWAPGPIWTVAENLVPSGILRPDRPAHSESLYRLSYPDPLSFLRFANVYWPVSKTCVTDAQVLEAKCTVQGA
jgi:hypothetical protein